MCVQSITFELNDLRPRYLTCLFILTPSASSLKVKVTGESSQSPTEKCPFSVTDVCSVTHFMDSYYVRRHVFFLFVELFALQWFVRPQVRASNRNLHTLMSAPKSSAFITCIF